MHVKTRFISVFSLKTYFSIFHYAAYCLRLIQMRLGDACNKGRIKNFHPPKKGKRKKIFAYFSQFCKIDMKMVTSRVFVCVCLSLYVCVCLSLYVCVCVSAPFNNMMLIKKSPSKDLIFLIT